MKRQKREHILHSAMELFNKTGFHGTPTSKIAKTAGVSVGTLFNYFPTKEKLIESIYVHIKLHSKMEFIRLLEETGNTHDTLQSMFRSIVLWGIENPEEFNYLEMFRHTSYHSRFCSEKALEAYQQFQHQLIKKVVPVTICDTYPDYVLSYVDNSIHAATRYLLIQEVEDQEHFISSSFDLLWKGFTLDTVL